MSKPDEMTLMKRAALGAILKHAVKAGTVQLTKSAAERRARMVAFLKQGGVRGHEVLALCKSASMPSEKAFQKVAKAARMDVQTVKAAYLSKQGLLGTLAGGTLGGLAGYGKYGPVGGAVGALLGGAAGSTAEKIPEAISHAMNPYQMSPERRALYQRIQNEAVGNRRLSQDLQAINGTYAPAGNPWGSGAGGLMRQ